MPDHIENSELLHAYALGCLDKCDEKIFEEYLSRLSDKSEWNESLQSTGDAFLEKLGEYQNLVALLPVRLKIIGPDPKGKDKIARKLYRMRDEIRKKKESILNYQLSEPFRTTIVSSQQEDLNYKKTFDGSFKQLLEFEKVESKQNECIDVLPYLEEIEIHRKNLGRHSEPFGKEGTIFEKKYSEKQNKSFAENKEKQGEPVKKADPLKEFRVKKNNRRMFAGIFVFIFLAGLISIYFYFSKEIDDNKERVIKLNEEKSSLITQLSELKNFSEFLSAKDLDVVNLTGNKILPDANGKLFLSFSMNTGYLRLINIQPSGNGVTYQLWMQNGNESISLGLINPIEPSISKIQIPHMSSIGNIKFLLTEEPANGSEKPGKKILLEGLMK